ncbi:FecR family protein [Teredinibacter haidensis]|uniref:FecR family protein n=1 Tax=Teredinibacter haidensis TaxID=2731755 RepID=UPI0009F954E3|nr:FecR domain-containing protein [Teredinibacter haidensis]
MKHALYLVKEEGLVDKANSDTNINDIKHQAAEWLVRMDEAPLSPAETNEFHQWIKQSPYHSSYFLKVVKQWDNMAILEDLARIFPRANTQTNPHQVQKSRRRWLGLPKLYAYSLTGGFAAAAFSIVLALFINIELDNTQHFETRPGERATYTLTDGSVLMLNTDTQLDVDYREERRTISLIKGEANFEVAKNKQYPFVVKAANSFVWAVGTAFNVRYLNSQVDVAVSEGTVKVFANAAPHQQKFDTVITDDNQAILTQGYSVRINRTLQEPEALNQTELEQKLAWLDGALIFNGIELGVAIEEISRYTSSNIVVKDSNVAKIRIGGHFKTDNIDSLLQTLSKSFSIKVTKLGNGDILLSKGSPYDT